MTRLSEALKRAADTSADSVMFRDDAPAPAWQFPLDERVADVAPAALPFIAPVIAPVVAPVVDTPIAAAPSPATPSSATLASRFDPAERSRLVIGDAESALVEQYRHLAAVLHHAQSASGYRSVMVTSALPSEGKTLTATNLALTLSESYQRRVLLVDADLRRPRIKDLFGLPDGPGLTDSLNSPGGGQLPVHQITPTLWVLTAGRATADPMSTLVSGAMKQLLDEARDAFDWVVVDTPPIAILPDANLLASMIDTALLVVSAQSTPYPMVQRAAQAIGPSRILGVVLNRAEQSGMPSGYGYYARSGAVAQEQRPRWSRWFGKGRGVPHVQ
ncbi:MAG: CpsD/CapB family tyrosine-protein kinase [Acidobacteriota bacterium]|nr:CpsD/CapB family tyrosine-protein kinase [Acidobacteriota bacterium]